VVDGAAQPGGSGGAGGASTTGVGASTVTVGPSGTGTIGSSGTPGTTAGTSTGSGIQVPDGGSAQCLQDYYTMVKVLEDALGCTPTAPIMQCGGSSTLQDPCGCFHVVNEAHLPPLGVNQLWQQCVSDGCCGPGANGCGPCPPAPTVGHCDSFTSQCVPGP
jgi:hypothetical protein